MKKKLLITLLCSLLCACTLRAKPDDLYVIKASIPPTASSCAAHLILQVNEPQTAPGLESSRIAIFDTPTHLTYYTGAAWAVPLPQMFQAFMVSALAQSHRFKSVGSDIDNIAPDISVLITVRDFEVRQSASPQARVAIAVKIINGKTNHLLNSSYIEKTALPAENHMPSIVSAFNQVANEAASAVVDLLTECSSSRRANVAP